MKMTVAESYGSPFGAVATRSVSGRQSTKILVKQNENVGARTPARLAGAHDEDVLVTRTHALRAAQGPR
jgi:hypothetical protein